MSKQYKKKMEKQYWKGSYEGMYGSLKHNILLMLSQMEGNLEHSKFNAIPYLEFIESRVKEIIFLICFRLSRFQKRYV